MSNMVIYIIPKHYLPEDNPIRMPFTTLEELLLVGGKNSREINKAEKPN
jgi:hypothetical protein